MESRASTAQTNLGNCVKSIGDQNYDVIGKFFQKVTLLDLLTPSQAQT